MPPPETPGEIRGSRAFRFTRIVAFVLTALLLAGLIRGLVFQVFEIPSDSMEPTLKPGERILVWRPAAMNPPRRGDVVVIDGRGSFLGGNPPGGADIVMGWFGLGNSDVYFVKRVIGVGGDTVACCDEQERLTINGKPLKEPYLAEPEAPASAQEFKSLVPAGHVWVMGDNRNDSADSRSLLGAPGGGMIPDDRVVGRVTMVAWPRQGTPDQLP